MRKLVAKRKASKYKNNASFIDAVYRNNKNYIDMKLFRINSKESFKNLIIEQFHMFDGQNPPELSSKQINDILNRKSKRELRNAVRELSVSDAFSSYEERQQYSAYSAVHEYKEVFKEFRKATGWKQKIDISKFEWDKDEHTYVYKGAKNTVYIDLTGSPKNMAYIMSFNKSTRQYEKEVIAEWNTDRKSRTWKNQF